MSLVAGNALSNTAVRLRHSTVGEISSAVLVVIEKLWAVYQNATAVRAAAISIMAMA